MRRLAEARSLAYHAAVSARLRADPTLMSRVEERVHAWERRHVVSSYYSEAWKTILAQPLDEIIAFLADSGDYARELRQVSPFAGVIDARERWRIWREVTTHFSA